MIHMDCCLNAPTNTQVNNERNCTIMPLEKGLNKIKFIIWLQNNSAICCENLEILCSVVFKILDLSHYYLDDPHIICVAN